MERQKQKHALDLTDEEMRRLEAVRHAFSCMNKPVTDEKAKATLQKSEHTPEDTMNIMDVTIRRIVRTFKKLAHFQEISNEGKLQLLRNGMIKFMTVRGAFLLDNKMECWSTPTLPGAKISLDIFDRLGNSKQREDFMSFCDTLHKSLRADYNVMYLLTVVIAFDSTSDSVRPLPESDREIVRRHHQMYSHLLHRYVESVHRERAPELLRNLPFALLILTQICETAVSIYMGRVDLKEVELLPTEFFKMSRYDPNDGMIPSTSAAHQHLNVHSW